MTNRRALFHCFAVRGSSSTEPRVFLWPVKRPYIYRGPVLNALSANQHLACYDLGIWVPSALRQRKFNKLQLSTSWRGEEKKCSSAYSLPFTPRQLYPEKELPPQRNIPLPTADLAGWASVLVWMFWKIENSVHPAGIWNPNRGIVALPPTLSWLCPNLIVNIINNSDYYCNSVPKPCMWHLTWMRRQCG